jgi:hypothetical protein
VEPSRTASSRIAACSTCLDVGNRKRFSRNRLGQESACTWERKMAVLPGRAVALISATSGMTRRPLLQRDLG